MPFLSSRTIVSRLCDSDMHPQSKGDRLDISRLGSKSKTDWIEFAFVPPNLLENGGNGRPLCEFFLGGRNRQQRRLSPHFLKPVGINRSRCTRPLHRRLDCFQDRSTCLSTDFGDKSSTVRIMTGQSPLLIPAALGSNTVPHREQKYCRHHCSMVVAQSVRLYLKLQ